MNDSWHSYPSVYALGHRALSELLLDPVLVESKIDGSQFSFGLFEDGYRCRSKGAQLNLLAPEKMFVKAVEIIKTLPLHVGWTYRGEYLLKPKHNTLCYDRVPKNNIILFDINPGHEEYLPYDEKAAEAERIGLEVVPRLFEGMLTDISVFRELLEHTSILGGTKIEGCVIKNYTRFGPDKKVLMGKFVSESFKEVHGREWKKENPTSSDIIELITDKYRSGARWMKAVQHLREAGTLEESPRDIPALMKEVMEDVERECTEEIRDAVFVWCWPKIRRGLTHGLPEWWKEELVKKQFEKEA